MNPLFQNNHVGVKYTAMLRRIRIHIQSVVFPNSVTSLEKPPISLRNFTQIR